MRNPGNNFSRSIETLFFVIKVSVEPEKLVQALAESDRALTVEIEEEISNHHDEEETADTACISRVDTVTVEICLEEDNNGLEMRVER